LIFALVQLSWGTTPYQITYQGVLKDDVSGEIVADGSYDMAFSIFEIDVGGTANWTETHVGVSVVGGLFTVELGSLVSFPGGGAARFDVPYWLEIQIGSTVLSPRTKLQAVPYANAARSVYGSWNELQSRGRLGINTVGSADTTKAIVLTDQGMVGIGTTLPESPLHITSDSTTYVNISGDGGTYSYSGLWLESGLDGQTWGLLHRKIAPTNNFTIQSYDGTSLRRNRFSITPGGNVGIGTVQPSAKLEVVGTIKADTIMVDTTTRWQSIPAAAFAPAAHNVNYTLTDRYIIPTWGAASFYAPIDLPQGAVIKGLLVTVKDDSTQDIWFELDRVDFSTGNSTSLGGMSSAGESAVVVLNRGYNITVDNSSYGYLIRVDYAATGTEAAYCFYGARVQYEIASPLP
jgi:hypothetical protein